MDLDRIGKLLLFLMRPVVVYILFVCCLLNVLFVCLFTECFDVCVFVY